jgi:hypothetical protein
MKNSLLENSLSVIMVHRVEKKRPLQGGWQGCHSDKDNLMRPNAPLLEGCVISFRWRLEYEVQSLDSYGSCSYLCVVRTGRLPEGTDNLDRAGDDAGTG